MGPRSFDNTGNLNKFPSFSYHYLMAFQSHGNNNTNESDHNNDDENSHHHGHNNTISHDMSMSAVVSNELQYILVILSTLCLLWLTFYTFSVYLRYRQPSPMVTFNQKKSGEEEVMTERSIHSSSFRQSSRLHTLQSIEDGDDHNRTYQKSTASNMVYKDQMFHIVLMAGLSLSLLITQIAFILRLISQENNIIYCYVVHFLMVYGRNSSSLWCFSISWTLYCLTCSDNSKHNEKKNKESKKSRNKSSQDDSKGMRTTGRHTTLLTDTDDNLTYSTNNNLSPEMAPKESILARSISLCNSYTNCICREKIIRKMLDANYFRHYFLRYIWLISLLPCIGYVVLMYFSTTHQFIDDDYSFGEINCQFVYIKDDTNEITKIIGLILYLIVPLVSSVISFSLYIIVIRAVYRKVVGFDSKYKKHKGKVNTGQHLRPPIEEEIQSQLGTSIVSRKDSVIEGSSYSRSSTISVDFLDPKGKSPTARTLGVQNTNSSNHFRGNSNSYYKRLRNYFLLLMCYPLINGLIAILLALQEFIVFDRNTVYTVFSFLEDLQGTLIVVVFVLSNYPILCIKDSSYHCYKAHWCFFNRFNSQSLPLEEDNKSENYFLNCQSLCGQVMCPCEEYPVFMNCCIYTLLCKYSMCCKNSTSLCCLQRGDKEKYEKDSTTNRSTALSNRSSNVKHYYYADIECSAPEVQLSVELLPSLTSTMSRDSYGSSFQ